MFVMTMSKTMLRRIGAAAVCTAALAAGAIGLKVMGNDAVETAASPVPGLNQKIAGAQDLQGFLAGYGVQADPAAAQVSQVKIPRKWDESFQAFHDVIRKSGLDLSKCKNRTVDKWVVPVPAQSNESIQAYAVVIVYKEQARGAYFLQKPSGEVLPMTPPTAPAAGAADLQNPTGSSAGSAAPSAPSAPAGVQVPTVPEPSQAPSSAQNTQTVSEPVNADAPVEVAPEAPALETGAVPTE